MGALLLLLLHPLLLPRWLPLTPGRWESLLGRSLVPRGKFFLAPWRRAELEPSFPKRLLVPSVMGLVSEGGFWVGRPALTSQKSPEFWCCSAGGHEFWCCSAPQMGGCAKSREVSAVVLGGFGVGRAEREKKGEIKYWCGVAGAHHGPAPRLQRCAPHLDEDSEGRGAGGTCSRSSLRVCRTPGETKMGREQN